MTNPLLDTLWPASCLTASPLSTWRRPWTNLLAACRQGTRNSDCSRFPGGVASHRPRRWTWPPSALGMAWGAVSHLNSVADTPELRAAYNAALPRVTEFWTRLGSDERLYAKYKAIDCRPLSAAEQKQAHKNALRGFVLGGAELQGAAKERYAVIQERLAEIIAKVQRKHAWTLQTNSLCP